ncbi:MAG: T9SS type A sorting domain-containing protein, partial [Bacteroidetes bacterium]|nr:T9SS type A sorting domain-containing protein [Bacteroidota bacterium]
KIESGKSITIDIRSLDSGLYFLVIENDEGKLTERIVIE